MIPYGKIKARLQALLKDESTATAADILLYTNEAIRDIASDHFFDTLKREVSFSSLLPADMERPFYIQLNDTDFLSFPISETSQYTSRKLFGWWMDRVTTDPLSIGSDGVIAANGTAFSSASPSVAFTSDMIGEFIQIGENEGIYEITAVPSTTTLTLADGFRGAAETAAHYEVRPQFTQQMQVTDEDGTNVNDEVSTFIYQKIPLPIYNDYDPIPLPGNCKAVRIMVQQMLLLGDKYDNDALKRQPDFQRAIDKMKPLQPTRGRTPAPRNKYGTRIVYGRFSHNSHIRVDRNNRRILGR
jgi:hypothetical protein